MFRLNLTLSFHFHNDLLSMIKMFFVCLFLVFVQIWGINYMQQIILYLYCSLVEIQLYQGYLTCHVNWHMNMCFTLVRLHKDMLTLFKRSFTKEQISMQKVNMETCLYIWHVETTMMEWFQCYSWYSIYFFSLPTHSLFHRSKIVHVFYFL
jgi:hypothetical protein